MGKATGPLQGTTTSHAAISPQQAKWLRMLLLKDSEQPQAKAELTVVCQGSHCKHKWLSESGGIIHRLFTIIFFFLVYLRTGI